MDTENSVIIAREMLVGASGEGIGGINDDGWRLDLGGEHTTQCTDGNLNNFAT